MLIMFWIHLASRVLFKVMFSRISFGGVKEFVENKYTVDYELIAVNQQSSSPDHHGEAIYKIYWDLVQC